MKQINIKVFTQAAMISMALAISATSANAALLNLTSVTQLTKPVIDAGLPVRISPLAVSPTTGTFAESWTGTTAAAPWQGGQFEVTGADNRPPAASGNVSYDFTSLTAGALPISSYFTIGDLDNGSGGGEILSVTAFSSIGVPILTPWLDLLGTTASVNSELPTYQWNELTGEYLFDGTGVPSNPAVAFSMLTTTAISFLDVNKPSFSYSYNITAPETSVVPVPAAVWLFGSGLIGLIGIARRKKA